MSDFTGLAEKLGHIYMDSPTFGMGCCCLQTTLQARNLSEARKMFDILVVVAPIMVHLQFSIAGTSILFTDLDIIPSLVGSNSRVTNLPGASS